MEGGERVKNEDILEAILEYADLLSIANFFSNIVRSIGYALVGFLMWVVDSLTATMKDILGFIGFYNADSMGETSGILHTLSDFQKFGIGLTILIIGVTLFVGKSQETKEVPMNILMMILLLMLLPNIMSDGVKIVKATNEAYETSSEPLALSTFKKNVTDVYTLADNGWTTTEPEQKNYLKNLTAFDVNETLTDEEKIDNGEVFKYKVRNKVNEEGYELVELYNGDEGMMAWVTRLFSEHYYRWSVAWTPLIVTLACLCLALVISLLRVARLGIELGFNYVWANIIAFFSFKDIKRLKMTVMEIITAFVVVISIFTMYYIFLNYTAFVDSLDVGFMAKLFGYAGGAWFVYDGPAIIQKTLGVDAGLSTAGGVMFGMSSKKAIESVTGAAKTTAKKSGEAAVSTAGFMKGFFGKEDGKNSEDSGINKAIESNEDKNKNDTENTNETKPSSANESADSKKDDIRNDDVNEADNGVNEEVDDTSNSDLNNEDETRSSEGDLPEDKNTIDSEKDSTDSNIETSSGEDATEPVKNDLDGERGENSDPADNNNELDQKDENNSKNESASKNTDQSSEESVTTDTSPNSADSANNGDSNTKEKEPSEENPSTNLPKDSSDNTAEETNKEAVNPFKKKIHDSIHTPNYMKNNKGRIGNTVDNFNRNKDFGSDVRDWLTKRKEDKNKDK